MAQWRSVASLDRWIGPWHCSSPLPPFGAPVPAAPRRRRRARRNVRIGCASVPRELGAAAEADQLPAVIDSAEEEGVVCGGCGDAGWVLCDFCKGKKNNVKPEEGTRVYRRCPTCKAAGFILCPRCRVYKCITFPEQ